MVSGKTSEELPPGWKEYVKVKNGRKTKYFTSLATGQKFYSKKSVMRFVNSLEICQGSSPSTSNPNNGSMPCKSEATPDDVKTNESPEWLPHGWTVESRTRRRGSGAGSVYKIYIDPLTGSKFYSKPQVMQYLQGIEKKNAGCEQQLQISDETPLEHRDMSQSVEGKINSPGENKNVTDKPSFKVVEENSDELPPGCTREIKTRKRVHGKQDTSQASESLTGKNHIPGENENDIDKPSLKVDYSDVQKNSGLDELPPGWIKETKTRKCGPGTRQDPYYIDTASGYAFRSKKDVMRYLDTGDINRCAIKPQKWDLSELKLIKEDTHHSTPHDVNKSGEPVTRRQLFICQKPENGKESSQTSTIVTTEAEKLKEKEGDCLAAAEAENSKDKDKDKADSIPAHAAMSTASAIEETHLGSGTMQGDKSGENLGVKSEGSKQDMKIVHDNIAVDSTDIGSFHEQNPTENCLDTETKDLRKSKKRKAPSMPGRSSKRLAGHEPEMVPDFSLTERALRASIKKPHGVGSDRALGKAMNTAADEVLPQHPVTQAETTMPSSLSLNTAADEVPQQPVREAETTSSSNLGRNTVANEMSEQPVTEVETMVAPHTSVSGEASLEMDMQNNFKMPLENPVLQQTTGLVNERQVEENPMPQGDYWSDPCWDFAFKTLTGAIPLEETLTLPSCFPQPTGISYAQENLTFGMPEFEIPPIFQNDEPQAGPAQNNVPADQLPTNPTLAPPGNIGLPGCSSQPPNLEAQSKDYQTKVKS